MGDDNIKVETQKLFDNSADNFKSYLAIKKCENDIKTSVLNEIFDGVTVGLLMKLRKSIHCIVLKLMKYMTIIESMR